MTFALSIITPNSSWIAADFRISIPLVNYKGEIIDYHPQDEGDKIFIADFKDGRVVLAYSGLGKTRAGVEPSTWMNNMFQLESIYVKDALERLTIAMKVNFGFHLDSMGLKNPSHEIIGGVYINTIPHIILLKVDSEMIPGYFHYVMELKHLSKGNLSAMYTGSGKNHFESAQRQELENLIIKHSEGKAKEDNVFKFIAACFLRISQKDKFVSKKSKIIKLNKDGSYIEKIFDGTNEVRKSTMKPISGIHNNLLPMFKRLNSISEKNRKEKWSDEKFEKEVMQLNFAPRPNEKLL